MTSKFATPFDSEDHQPESVPVADQVYSQPGRDIVPRRALADALVKREDGAMVYKRFVLRSIGMEIPSDVTKDELEDVGIFIKGLESSIQWIVGDWANALEFVWGKTYAEIAAKLGYEIKTIYEWAYVCRKVSIRMEKLRFGHHQAVANLPADAQQAWLDWAVSGGVSVTELRQAMSKGKPNKPHLVPREVKHDWQRVWGLDVRLRTPEQRNEAQKSIDRLRAALDVAERGLWE